MPQTPVLLNKKQHAALTYKALGEYSFAAGMTTMPLLPFEVPEAARCFPIIFPDTRNATPHALLGLGDKNIFVDDRGRWTAPYLPLVAANHPFSLAEARFSEEPDKKEMALAIVEDAPHFHQPDGKPLYGPDGEATELLQHITNAMANQFKRYRESEKALAELQLSGVLKEKVVAVGARGQERTVGGLRCADRARTLALPENTLGRWAKSGVLEMLYAHWASMVNLRTLLDHPSCPRQDKPPLQ